MAKVEELQSKLSSLCADNGNEESATARAELEL